MAEAQVRRANENEYMDVDASEGLQKAVLIGESDGAPNFTLRKFVLEPGTKVPRHTNKLEHEQYILEGEFIVGIDDEEYTVAPGDSLLIPAGTVHWYRNEAGKEAAFICVVPNGDDEILLEE